ncbi:MAG: pseudouridine synthase [Candidatus Woesearchaeota archaeon]
MVEERVQKIIAESGLCSRRKAETLIEEGVVKVNNKTITIGDKADKTKDIITINNKPIKIEKKVYYMLNKPKEYITTSDDLFDRKIVTELVPEKPRVFAIGRLDRDATGLLLLTNDGDFANKIMHPRYEINKTYVVTLKNKPFNKDDLIYFKQGIKIDKTFVKSKVKIIDEYTLEVTLHVGIHKVVKRLFKELGYYVKDLQRSKIGNLKLDIPIRSYRELTEKDKELIFKKE